MTGTVKWFDAKRGYGFIQLDEEFAGRMKNPDVFVHYSAICDAQGGHRVLYATQRVELDVIQGRKGFQAENVVVMD